MSTFTEITYISQFDIQLNGCINVRKTTDVLKDGVVISSTYWRCVLQPSETVDTQVINEPYYANIAQAAWTPEVLAAYEEQLAQQIAARAEQGA